MAARLTPDQKVGSSNLSALNFLPDLIARMQDLRAGKERRAANEHTTADKQDDALWMDWRTSP